MKLTIKSCDCHYINDWSLASVSTLDEKVNQRDFFNSKETTFPGLHLDVYLAGNSVGIHGLYVYPCRSFWSGVWKCYINIKTHDSELRDQEEVAIMRETKNTWPLSELFTHSNTQKFTNAIAKSPYKLLLSYYRSSMFLLYVTGSWKTDHLHT